MTLPFCPNCGKAVPENATFCPSCSYRLTGSSAPNISPGPPPAYRKTQPQAVPANLQGSLGGGVAIGFVLLILIGWIPIIGALIAGFVAGLIARGAGRGAAAGFIAGIVGGIIAVFVLTALGSVIGGIFGLGVLGGAIGAGVGGYFFLLAIGDAILSAIGGAVGGAIRHR